MRVLGKIVGAVAGLKFGWIAVLCGIAIGHAFDAGFWRVKLRSGQQVFAHTLFTLLGYLARVDGRVSERETAFGEQLMDQLDMDHLGREQAVQHFNFGRAAQFDPHFVLRDFVAQFSRRSDPCEQLLACLISAAYVDGEIEAIERDAIRLISADLGFRQEELLRLIDRYRPSRNSASGDLAAAYATLQINADASVDEIKKAYRRLISQYHPDKLQGAGIRGDALVGAQNKASEVRAAYDRILAARGNS
jgi:DnaJ like chaperone protein